MKFLFQIALLVWLGSSAFGQSAPTGLVHELNRDVLIEVTRKINGNVIFMTPNGSMNEKIKVKESMKVIDTLSLLGEAGPNGTRYYLEDQVTEGGVIKDSARAGTVLRHTHKKDYLNIDAAKNQLVGPVLSQEDELRNGGMAGILAFPASMQIGDKTTIEMMGIFCDLTGNKDKPESACAQVELVEYDEKKSTAVLKGTFSASVALDEENEIMPATYEGSCSFVIDCEDSRLIRIELSCAVLIDATIGGMVVKGKAALRSKWRSSIGKKVEKARKKKVKFRPVPRFLEELHVGFALPSHYQEPGDLPMFGEGFVGFTSGVRSMVLLRCVGVRVVETEQPLDAVLKESIKQMKLRMPGSEFRKSKSKLGTAETVMTKREGVVIIKDFVKGNGAILIFAYLFPAADMKVGMAEVALVRKTLSHGKK